MATQLPDLPPISKGAKRNVSISLDSDLALGVLLTGTPTVVELTTSALVIADQAVSSATLTIEQKPVIAGRAVQFSVDAAGATIGTTYRIQITVTADDAPDERLVYWVDLPCE